MTKLLLLIVCLATTTVAQEVNSTTARDLLPRGEHPVGFRLSVLEDNSRTFTTQSGGAGARPVRTFVWYPARRNQRQQQMTFRHNVTAEGKGTTDASVRFNELSGGDALSEAQIAAVLDAPIEVYPNAGAASGRFPLVLLGGGLNATAYIHTLLAEHLASHGYVVVAISSLAAREGERLAFDPNGLGLLVGDFQFVLRHLSSDRQVNSNRLGFVGWSVGGVALAAVQAQDDRVKAFLSLDSGLGYNYGLPLLKQYVRTTQPLNIPVLDLQALAPSRFVVPRDATFFTSARGSVTQLKITSLNHAQCTSLPVLISAISGAGDHEKLRDGYRALAAYTKAFLDWHVRKDRQGDRFLKRTPAENGFKADEVGITRS